MIEPQQQSMATLPSPPSVPAPAPHLPTQPFRASSPKIVALYCEIPRRHAPRGRREAAASRISCPGGAPAEHGQLGALGTLPEVTPQPAHGSCETPASTSSAAGCETVHQLPYSRPRGAPHRSMDLYRETRVQGPRGSGGSWPRNLFHATGVLHRSRDYPPPAHPGPGARPLPSTISCPGGAPAEHGQLGTLGTLPGDSPAPPGGAVVGYSIGRHPDTPPPWTSYRCRGGRARRSQRVPEAPTPRYVVPRGLRERRCTPCHFAPDLVVPSSTDERDSHRLTRRIRSVMPARPARSSPLRPACRPAMRNASITHTHHARHIA